MRWPVLVLAAAGGLAAHDLYLLPDTFRPGPGAVMRVEYHNGDAFPRSQAAVRIDRLRDQKILAAGTATPFRGFRIEGPATVAEASAPSRTGVFALISRTLPNFIQLDAAKFEEYLKHEALEHVALWRKNHGESAKPGREMYSKYVKALCLAGPAGPGFDAVTGLAIEFVPLANPYELSAGATLPVRVLFRGKPAAGLGVEASTASAGKTTKKLIGRTGRDGEIRVPLAAAGVWKLHTILMERRSETKEADWESYWASLTFEIGNRKR